MRPLLAALVFLAATACAQQKPFTVAEALSAPFMNQLTAAPAKNRVAWFVDEEGRRNVWAASPTDQARSLTHYTADDGQDIDNITWSPDGERVAYTHGTGPEGAEHPDAANPAHLQRNVQQSVEIATWQGEVRTVGVGSAPVFSIDGRQVYFLHDGKVFANAVQGDAAQARQLIVAEGRATQLRPSPDGTKLAFVSDRGDHSFIGIFDLQTKTLTYADPGTGLDHDPVWSEDSRRIAFLRESPVLTDLDLRWMRSVPVPWSIRIANVTTGEGKQVWQADKGSGSLFHEMAAKNQLLWMHDGSLVFPWEKTGWLNLYALRPDDKEAKALTPGSFEVDTVVTDGDRIVYSSNQVTGDPRDADRRHLWSVSDGATAPAALTGGEGIETEPVLLNSGEVGYMGAGVDTPFHPMVMTAPVAGTGDTSLPPCDTAEPLGGRCRGMELLKLTRPLRNVPEASQPAFVTPQQITYKASDSLLIHGQWFLPKNTKPTDRLPTIVFFHGGSRRQMLLGYHPMQYYAQTYAMNQYFVAHGYAVLSVNYRSGTGYGMEFRQAANFGVFGGSEYNDIQGAVRWLKQQPNVDPKRIGAWGGSYGGYLTALALARDSGEFAAGVDLHGVHDWSYEMDAWKATSDPAYDAAVRAKIAFTASPMADVAKWKSPVLLMQGDDDRNVLFGQTVRLAAALRANGVHVEETIFPDEVHDFLLHRDWVSAFERAADFFDRNLRDRR